MSVEPEEYIAPVDSKKNDRHRSGQFHFCVVGYFDKESALDAKQSEFIINVRPAYGENTAGKSSNKAPNKTTVLVFSATVMLKYCSIRWRPPRKKPNVVSGYRRRFEDPKLTKTEAKENT